MGASREEAAEEERGKARPTGAGAATNARSASHSAVDLRSLQLVALARGTYGPSAPLTSAGIRAIQRTAGNRAACQVIKVQRLQHPDFPKKAAEMNDMELLKAYRFNVEGDTFGIGLPPADLAAVRSEMRRRRIPETATNPLDDHRDLLPTRGNVVTEVAKPTAAAAALAAGNLGARGLSTAPGAISPGGEKDLGFMKIGGPTSTHSAVGAEVFGGLLLVDSLVGVGRGFSAMDKAAKRGDTAGHRLGTRKVQQQGWGVAGGATGVAGGGIKLGAALGSTAAGLAAAAGGLGIAGGALTAAEGSWKIYRASRKMWDLSKITLLSASGQKWKEYAEGREKRKAGINVLKVAAGALGIAAGALLIASNPAGWALGIAAMAVGGAYALGKVGSKIADVSKRRSAKKEAEAAEKGKGILDPLAKHQTPEQTWDDPGRRKEVHAMADKVAQENSQNARYAAAMIAALQKGDEKKLEKMVAFRDAVFPQDNDFQQTRAYMKAKRQMEISNDDLERHDAELILEVFNVPTYMALSESGQDLIQKKLSVAEAS